MQTYARFSFRSVIAAAVIFATCALPIPAMAAGGLDNLRGQACRDAIMIMPEFRRVEILNQLIDSGILLGSLQLEAVIKVAAFENLLPGMRISAADLFRVQSKKPLKNLAKFLGGTDAIDAHLRRSFAEKVVLYFENTMLPKKLGVHPLERKVALKGIAGDFYGDTFLRPGADSLDKAWISFHEIIQKPGGRELLTVALMNSNASIAYSAARLQSSPKTVLSYAGMLVGIGPLLSLVPGLGGDVSGLMLLGASFVAPAFAGKVTGTSAVSLLRLKKVVLSRRLRKLIARTEIEMKSGKTPDDETVTLAVAKAPNIEDIKEPELNAVFDRALVKAEAQDVEKIKTDLGTGDFNAVSTFGTELISRVDQAVDLIALMSKRMELLEKDVQGLSNSISDGKLTVPMKDVLPVIESSFQTSSDVLQDGEQLEVYLRLLQDKIAEHVATGQFALEHDKLTSSNAKAEMEDVLEELRNAQLTIEPSTKILPMMNQVAQSQRSAIRELRTSLRGHKLSHSEQIGKLVETIAKLKSVKISEPAKTN